MNKEEQLNKFLDGELTESEVSLLVHELDSDHELAATLEILSQNKQLHEQSIPEPLDEFSIEQEFLEIQKKIKPKNTKNTIPFPGKWLYSSIGVAAALILTFGIMWNQPQPSGSEFEAHTTTAEYTIPTVETDIEGASSMIFTDEQSGWTFVWIDEPQTATDESIAG